MKFIQLQDDAKPDNKWVAEYIRIGEIWESVVDAAHGQIQGKITPYGFDAELQIELSSGKYLHIAIDKQLQNVTTGLEFGPAPFSQVLDIKMDLRENPQRAKLKIVPASSVGTSLLSRLSGWLRGYKYRWSKGDYICFYDDEVLFKKLISMRIAELKKLHNFSIKDNFVKLKIYSFPEEKYIILKIVKLCKEIYINI